MAKKMILAVLAQILRVMIFIEERWARRIMEDCSEGEKEYLRKMIARHKIDFIEKTGRRIR